MVTDSCLGQRWPKRGDYGIRYQDLLLYISLREGHVTFGVGNWQHFDVITRRHLAVCKEGHLHRAGVVQADDNCFLSVGDGA